MWSLSLREAKLSYWNRSHFRPRSSNSNLFHTLSSPGNEPILRSRDIEIKAGAERDEASGTYLTLDIQKKNQVNSAVTWFVGLKCRREASKPASPSRLPDNYSTKSSETPPADAETFVRFALASSQERTKERKGMKGDHVQSGSFELLTKQAAIPKL